jgi:FOG: PKD repeat
MKKLFAGIAVIALAVFVLCGYVSAGSDKCNDYTFDGTRSSAMGGQSLNYLWDFGDGTTGDKPVMTHHYEKAGEYTVKLTVTDQSGLPCDRGLTTQTVKVNTPPNVVFNGPDSICAGSEVAFDASATTSDSGKALTYKWSFGDGTSAEGQRVSKKYEKGGDYRVQLLVDDNQGTECSNGCAYLDVKVNTPPTANAGSDITMTCLRPGSPYTVGFNGSGSDADGDPLTYTWNFGDGATATGARVSHTYEKSGTYNATLIVDDGSGTACSSDSNGITVSLSTAPLADAGKDMTACAGSVISFDGSGSSSDNSGSVTYTWDFGDGTTATGVKATHAYETGGKHYATLTVDSGQCKSVSSVRVDVNSAPIASLEKVGAICVGDRVVFDASGSKDPDGDRLKYTWDFGDGELYDGGPQECRIYEKGGTYTVKVMVDDGKGTSCSADQASISINVNTKPIAAMSPVDACCVGVTTTFDATPSSDPDGDRLSYSWDFGDGTTSTDAKTTHVYSKAGRYKVIMKVDDGSGTPCSSSYGYYEANIHENPEAVISVR